MHCTVLPELCFPQPSSANWDRSKMVCCSPSQDLLSTAKFCQLGPFQNGMLLSESGLAVHSQLWPTGTVSKWNAALRVRTCCPQPSLANWDRSKMVCCYTRVRTCCPQPSSANWDRSKKLFRYQNQNLLVVLSQVRPTGTIPKNVEQQSEPGLVVHSQVRPTAGPFQNVILLSEP